jgi:hypothetical protein
MHQHWVPASYLRASCDPASKNSRDPWVSRFSKDGNEIRRRSPQNLFRESVTLRIIWHKILRATWHNRELFIKSAMNELASLDQSARESALSSSIWPNWNLGPNRSTRPRIKNPAPRSLRRPFQAPGFSRSRACPKPFR